MLWKLQQCLLNDWMIEWLNDWMALIIPLLLLCPCDLHLKLESISAQTAQTWTGPTRYFTSWPFPAAGIWQCFSDLRWCQNHLRKLVKMGIVGFYPQSFRFSDTEVGTMNLHFQVPQRCWALTLRTTECHLPSPWAHIPCILLSFLHQSL